MSCRCQPRPSRVRKSRCCSGAQWRLPLPLHFLTRYAAGLGFLGPVTFSVQASCSPCPMPSLGQPAAHEGSQLLPVPADARQIQLDLTCLLRLPGPLLTTPQSQWEPLRGRGQGTQPGPHSEPAPRLAFPSYTRPAGGHQHPRTSEGP